MPSMNFLKYVVSAASAPFGQKTEEETCLHHLFEVISMALPQQ